MIFSPVSFAIASRRAASDALLSNVKGRDTDDDRLSVPACDPPGDAEPSRSEAARFSV